MTTKPKIVPISAICGKSVADGQAWLLPDENTITFGPNGKSQAALFLAAR